MKNVSSIVNKTDQSKKVYINPNDFIDTPLQDNEIVWMPNEKDLKSKTIGTVVDYLFKYMIDGYGTKEEFEKYLNEIKVWWNPYKNIGCIKYYLKQIKNINKKLDYKCIDSALRLFASRNERKILEDKKLKIEIFKNIKLMVNRSLDFKKDYVPITAIDFRVKVDNESCNWKGGIVGEIDFLTKDTLWDLKTGSKLTEKDTLQVAMYYLIGKKSKQKIFNSIKKIGIYNPRLNIVYQLEIAKISKNDLKDICLDVIKYKNKKFLERIT